MIFTSNSGLWRPLTWAAVAALVLGCDLDASGKWPPFRKKKDEPKVETTNSERFLSPDEQREREKDREKEEDMSQWGGVKFRFPWAKKEAETDSGSTSAESSEVAEDPFGAPTAPSSPGYQDMSELELSPTQPAVASSVTPQSVNPQSVAPSPYASAVAPASTPDPTSVPASDSWMSQHMEPAQAPVSPVEPVQPVQSETAPEVIFTQIPQLQADSTNLTGDGIQFYTYGKTLAQVGTQIILASDVMRQVDIVLEANKDKIPPEAYEDVKETQVRKVLEQSIEFKLIYCDAIRTIPPEALKLNIQMIDEHFETKELPDALKKNGFTTRDDYEAFLKTQGTSIQQQKNLYREVMFCQQWLMQNIQVNPEVAPPEVIDYYRAHPEEFDVQPRARWEELVIRKSRFQTREQAYQEMVRVGSLVALQQLSFSEAAKQFSHGATSQDGGVNDWIKPGELASKTLENAIFTQPVGELSASILEDDRCFYVVRVLERDPLRHLTYEEVQGTIRLKIRNQKIEESRQKYLTKLRREIPVSTIFDGIPTPEERQNAARQARGFGN